MQLISILLICCLFFNNLNVFSASSNNKKSQANLMLIEGIEKNDENKVKNAIEDGADVNFETGKQLNSTPLISTIRTNQPQLTKLLLQNKADVNMQDKTGNSSLILALQLQNLDLIKAVLENSKDIDLELTNNQGESFFDILKQIANNDLKAQIESLIENYIKNQPTVPI